MGGGWEFAERRLLVEMVKRAEGRVLWGGAVFVAAYGLFQLWTLLGASSDQIAVYNLGIDTQAYLELGRQVAREGLFAIPMSHPPGFITYLALLFSLSASGIVLAKVLNLLFVVLTALCTFRIGLLRLGRAQGVIAALLVLCSPGVRAYAVTLQYEVLAMVLAWTALWLWIEAGACAAERRARVLQGLAMLLLAVATLTREPLALLLPALFLGERIRQGAWRPVARRWMAHLLIFLAPILLWIGWQFHAHGALVPISAKSEINIQVGFNPQANGSFNVVRSGIGAPSGGKFVLQHPAAAARLALRKVGYLWGALRDGWNVPREVTLFIWALSAGTLEYRLCLRLALLLPPAFFALGLLLLVKRGRTRHMSDILLALLLTTLCYGILFFGSYRFLLPLAPGVFLVAAEALVFVGAKLSWIRSSPVLALVALPIFGLLAPRLPFAFHLPMEWLDGVRVQTVVRPTTGQELFVPPEKEPRLAALFPAEYLPGGAVELLIHYGASSEGAPHVATALLRTRDGKSYCEVNLMPAPENSPLRAACALPHLTPVSFELHVRGESELHIQSVVVRRPE